jgi:hypothetical protein
LAYTEAEAKTAYNTAKNAYDSTYTFYAGLKTAYNAADALNDDLSARYIDFITNNPGRPAHIDISTAGLLDAYTDAQPNNADSALGSAYSSLITAYNSLYVGTTAGQALYHLNEEEWNDCYLSSAAILANEISDAFSDAEVAELIVPYLAAYMNALDGLFTELEIP